MSSSDLFPGFESHQIDLGEASIFCRKGGSGPPMLMLHGYPQTHAMWHKIAPELAKHFTLILPDSRGYGASSGPPSGPNHLEYSKRTMGQDMVRLMAHFGYDRFRIVGHDRGGRVSYRTALDHPDAIERIVCLDIAPTHTMWTNMDAKFALGTYHWMFLAQPEPLPEMLIEGAPVAYLDMTLASWTASGTLDPFAPRALDAYRAAMTQKATIHAMCEDYRAGATCDWAIDQADYDAGNRIKAPLLALIGVDGIPSGKLNAGEIWAEWAEDSENIAIESGHFMAEETPDLVLDHLLPFMQR